MRRAVLGTMVVAGLLVLSGCTAAANDVVTPPGVELAGFWQGVWHGLVSPVTLVVSLFRDDVGLYAVHNDGAWYDVGFMVGVSTVLSGGGGSTVVARGRRR